ncbi:MAG TPA: phosphate ABC transporter permease subunit PstC [Caldisericia bacterium]|nr:phosphate ABC transporter permease subunit PstC [Caldisericia bacterium]
MMKKLCSSDNIYSFLLYISGIFLILIVILIFIDLIISSIPSIKAFNLSFLVKSIWDPVRNEFGALPFIIGTLLTSFLAVIISTPLSIGSAILLDEYVSSRISNMLSSLIELLAAIPSVVYGLWGIFVLVPAMRSLEKFLYAHFSFIPFFNSEPYGVGVLTAIVILCIMIIPYSLSIIREVLKLVPKDQKEAGYALGATKWEVISKIKIPYIRSGIFAGIGLSLGRALGETMAVTMVIGNRNATPKTLFDPANTLASVIANEFTEATSSLHISSLIELGLILFIITFITNFIMRLILRKVSIKR